MHASTDNAGNCSAREIFLVTRCSTSLEAPARPTPPALSVPVQKLKQRSANRKMRALGIGAKPPRSPLLFRLVALQVALALLTTANIVANVSQDTPFVAGAWQILLSDIARHVASSSYTHFKNSLLELNGNLYVAGTVCEAMATYVWRAVCARHWFVVASKGTFYDMFFNDVDGKGNDIQRKGNRGFLYEIDDCVRSVNNSIEAGWVHILPTTS